MLGCVFSCPSVALRAGSGLRLVFAWIEELSTADVRCCVVVVEWVVVFRCMSVELMFVLFVVLIVGAKDDVVVAVSARSIKDWRSASSASRFTSAVSFVMLASRSMSRPAPVPSPRALLLAGDDTSGECCSD